METERGRQRIKDGRVEGVIIKEWEVCMRTEEHRKREREKERERMWERPRESSEMGIGGGGGR